MNLQEIYIAENHWLKDLEFLEMERKFLRKIIKDYLTDSGLISRGTVEQFNKRLFDMEITTHSLRDDIITNQTKIDLIIKDLVFEGKKEVTADYKILLNRFNELFSSFKQLKQDLFEVANIIIEGEAID